MNTATAKSAPVVSSSTGIDITELDAVGQASTGHKFQLKDPAGEFYPSPIYLIVIGRQADVVNKHYAKVVNDFIQKRTMAEKRGKSMEQKTAEQIQEDNIAGAAVRVVGWEGIKQSFDSGLLKQALKRNPHWIDQIVEESDELGNFTKKTS